MSITFDAGGSGCTPPTSYPDLFISLLGETQAAVTSKVTAAWTQLFHDPTNTNNVYYTGPGANEAYIWDVADNEVRTEGMSYGMMIAVQLDHQTEFDALWTFVKQYMAQPNGQFAWHTTTTGGLIDGATNSAPDGDEYFAMALVFAANRWGNAGTYNYANEAEAVLTTLVNQEFDPNLHLVLFGPGVTTFTDGSYVLPAFYQVWACVDPVNQAFWQTAVPAARTFFHNAANATTGIVPDHSSLAGAPESNFGSDAVRVVVNIMMDHNFFDADPWQTTWASTFAAFFQSQGPNYVDAYTPAGMPVDGGTHSPHIVACNATLGFGVSSSVGMPFVQALWNLPIPTGEFRYYDGMLYLLALLHVSGSFELWY